MPNSLEIHRIRVSAARYAALTALCITFVAFVITFSARANFLLRLSYPSPDVFALGVPITPLSPTVSGGEREDRRFRVSPSLPLGLVLSRRTGVISGTPTVVTPQSVYTITVTDDSARATALGYQQHLSFRAAIVHAASYPGRTRHFSIGANRDWHR